MLDIAHKSGIVVIFCKLALIAFSSVPKPSIAAFIASAIPFSCCLDCEAGPTSCLLLHACNIFFAPSELLLFDSNPPINAIAPPIIAPGTAPIPKNAAPAAAPPAALVATAPQSCSEITVPGLDLIRYFILFSSSNMFSFCLMLFLFINIFNFHNLHPHLHNKYHYPTIQSL